MLGVAIIFAFWLLLIFASGFCFGRASSYPRQDAREKRADYQPPG